MDQPHGAVGTKAVGDGAKAPSALVYLGGRPLTRDAMRAALLPFGVDAVPATSLSEALEAVDASAADAAIVDDAGLGQAATLEAVSGLVRRYPDLKVAVVSDGRSPTLPADAIRAGAAAYLSKDTPLEELRSALDRMRDGQLVVDAVVTRALLGIGNGSSNGSREPHLSPIERKVLGLAAAGRANKQVAAELGLSPLTVKNHVARIRARLGAADKAHAVALALRAGLLD
jgi:two-component system NarL family response regulator